MLIPDAYGFGSPRLGKAQGALAASGTTQATQAQLVAGTNGAWPLNPQTVTSNGQAQVAAFPVGLVTSSSGNTAITLPCPQNTGLPETAGDVQPTSGPEDLSAQGDTYGILTVSNPTTTVAGNSNVAVTVFPTPAGTYNGVTLAGGIINGGTANAGVSVPAGKSAIFIFLGLVTVSSNVYANWAAIVSA